MIGYKSIYDFKKYPKKVRADAAYAYATIILSQNKSKQSIEWINNSLELFTKEDLQKLSKSLFEASKTLRLLQQFKSSQDISKHYLQLNCENKNEINSNFYALLHQNQILIQNSTKDHIELFNSFEKCNINSNTLEEINHEIVESFIFTDNKDELLEFLHLNSISKADQIEIGKYLRFKFWQTNEVSRAIEFEKLKKLSEEYPFLSLENTIKK